MAVSVLEPCTLTTQPKLVLLGTFGNYFLMTPRLARASLLMNTDNSSSTLYRRFSWKHFLPP